MITEEVLRTTDLGLPEPPAPVLDRLESAGHARNGSCERCWGDAFGRAQAQPEKSQADHYLDVIAEANELATAEEETR